MKRTKAIIAAALLCSSILFTGCGLTEIDPFDEQYITYKVSGISGYTGRLDVDARNAPSGLTTYYHWDYDEPLSNGDIVKITVTPAEKILKQNGYKVSRMETEYTVSGLEELPETLPDEAANSIMNAMHDGVAEHYAKDPNAYTVGELLEYDTVQVKSVSDLQFVRGLYEVTTDRNAEDSHFKNEDDSETDYVLHPPRASFTGVWAVTYELEYLEDSLSSSNEAGDIVTPTVYYYGSINGFTVLDGKIHYNEFISPQYSSFRENPDESMEILFNASKDKEHLARVEY